MNFSPSMCGNRCFFSIFVRNISAVSPSNLYFEYKFDKVSAYMLGMAMFLLPLLTISRKSFFFFVVNGFPFCYDFVDNIFIEKIIVRIHTHE